MSKPVDQISSTVVSVLDEALNVQRPIVLSALERARERYPEDRPATVARRISWQYRAALAGSGAAVGGAAAAPGVGTGVGLALSLGETATSLEVTVLYVLTLAELHGLRVHEVERRRTLMLSILAGGSGPQIIEKAAGRTGRHWGRAVVRSIPVDTLRSINRVLGRNFVTKYGTKQGIVVLGRVAPFGFGVAIGGGANALLAESVIRGSRLAFGAPPTVWPYGL